MSTSSTSEQDLELLHDPRELAAFIQARIIDAKQHAEHRAALEAAGHRFEPEESAVHLRAEAAMKQHLLKLHPGAAARDSYCDGWVGPHDASPVPTHNGHCPIQLVMARVWQEHPDFPTWVLTEPITTYITDV